MTLAVQIDGQEKLKTYTPCSDFSVCINKFPRLVWEVCSDPYKQKDEWRSLAYGTSIVKLANYILADRGQSPHFILVVIYQTATHAKISTLYQDNGKVGRQLSLNQPMDMRLTNSIRFIDGWRRHHSIWDPRMIALNLLGDFINSRRYSEAAMKTHSVSILSPKDSWLILGPISSMALCTASPRNAKQTQGPRPEVVVHQQGLGSLFKGTSLYPTLSRTTWTSWNRCTRYEWCC